MVTQKQPKPRARVAGGAYIHDAYIQAARESGEFINPPPDNFVRRIIGYHGNNKVQQKGYAKISICKYLYLFIGISGTTFLNTIFWWKNQKQQQQHSKSND